MEEKHGGVVIGNFNDYCLEDFMYDQVTIFIDESGITIDGAKMLKHPIIKIKPLANNFKTPIKGDQESACYDCYATSKEYDKERNIWTYGLGFAVEPPKGYSIEIHPRSSIYKTGLALCNSTGIIDNQYRGEVMVKFYIATSSARPYRVGERVCQMKLVKDYQEELMLVDKLSDTERGAGGFGSTGLK